MCAQLRLCTHALRIQSEALAVVQLVLQPRRAVVVYDEELVGQLLEDLHGDGLVNILEPVPTFRRLRYLHANDERSETTFLSVALSMSVHLPPIETICTPDRCRSTPPPWDDTARTWWSNVGCTTSKRDKKSSTENVRLHSSRTNKSDKYDNHLFDARKYDVCARSLQAARNA